MKKNFLRYYFLATLPFNFLSWLPFSLGSRNGATRIILRIARSTLEFFSSLVTCVLSFKDDNDVARFVFERPLKKGLFQSRRRVLNFSAVPG